jgi:hypothetical protein
VVARVGLTESAEPVLTDLLEEVPAMTAQAAVVEMEKQEPVPTVKAIMAVTQPITATELAVAVAVPVGLALIQLGQTSVAMVASE